VDDEAGGGPLVHRLVPITRLIVGEVGAHEVQALLHPVVLTEEQIAFHAKSTSVYNGSLFRLRR